MVMTTYMVTVITTYTYVCHLPTCTSRTISNTVSVNSTVWHLEQDAACSMSHKGFTLACTCSSALAILGRAHTHGQTRAVIMSSSWLRKSELSL